MIKEFTYQIKTSIRQNSYKRQKKQLNMEQIVI